MVCLRLLVVCLRLLEARLTRCGVPSVNCGLPSAAWDKAGSLWSVFGCLCFIPLFRERLTIWICLRLLVVYPRLLEARLSDTLRSVFGCLWSFLGCLRPDSVTRSVLVVFLQLLWSRLIIFMVRIRLLVVCLQLLGAKFTICGLSSVAWRKADNSCSVVCLRLP